MAEGEGMIRLDDDHLLMIEPTQPATAPIIDSLVRRLYRAFGRAGVRTPPWKGWHTCVCGACSDNRDYIVMIEKGNELFPLKTNALAVHYMAQHRAEVPESEMMKLLRLPIDESEPSPLAIYGARYRIATR